MNHLTPSMSMTSREIADLTGKDHKHVLRDIDVTLETISPDLSQGFVSGTYVDDSGRTYRQFVLDRDSTYCLVAGYDANARMRIIKRWQALESGLAHPAFRLEPQDPPKSRQPALDAPQVQALKLTRFAMQAAKALGFRGNQAALSADHAVKAITGASPLALMGQMHLSANPRGQTYTPTEIGKMLAPAQSAVKTNRMIEKKGLQVKDIKGEWIPTDAARDLCEWLDTNKRHSDGTPVKQLKWFGALADALGEVAA
jgi:hypothetical protein